MDGGYLPHPCPAPGGYFPGRRPGAGECRKDGEEATGGDKGRPHHPVAAVETLPFDRHDAVLALLYPEKEYKAASLDPLYPFQVLIQEVFLFFQLACYVEM